MTDTSTFTSRLACCLNAEGAATSLTDYFAPTTRLDRGGYSGRFFDVWPDTARPNQITPADIVAVSALSVKVPPRAAAALFNREAIVEGFAKLDATEQLHELSSERAVQLIDDMRELNRQIRLIKDIGPTTASKLMAAKRPHLVPIWDSVVAKILRPQPDAYWSQMYAALSDDSTGIARRAEELRTGLQGELPAGISLLRIIDVVVWMRRNADKQVGDVGSSSFSGAVEHS